MFKAMYGKLNDLYFFHIFLQPQTTTIRSRHSMEKLSRSLEVTWSLLTISWSCFQAYVVMLIRKISSRHLLQYILEQHNHMCPSPGLSHVTLHQKVPILPSQNLIIWHCSPIKTKKKKKKKGLMLWDESQTFMVAMLVGMPCDHRIYIMYEENLYQRCFFPFFLPIIGFYSTNINMLPNFINPLFDLEESILSFPVFGSCSFVLLWVKLLIILHLVAKDRRNEKHNHSYKRIPI